jgi:hypothetical protein
MMIRKAMIVVTGLLLGACSTSTYQIKAESDKILDTVPSWYMMDFKEKKACNVNSQDVNEKQCIFGVGTSVSPDLGLAIEKAKMIAKAEMADIIKGEMNKRSKQFITELGKNESKSVVTDVESTLVNIIENTPVRGYEIFAQEVSSTTKGYYRAWIGLRLPLGEFNKMYNYTINEVVDSYNLKEKADKAFKETVKDKTVQ